MENKPKKQALDILPETFWRYYLVNVLLACNVFKVIVFKRSYYNLCTYFICELCVNQKFGQTVNLMFLMSVLNFLSSIKISLSFLTVTTLKLHATNTATLNFDNSFDLILEK